MSAVAKAIAASLRRQIVFGLWLFLLLNAVKTGVIYAIFGENFYWYQHLAAALLLGMIVFPLCCCFRRPYLLILVYLLQLGYLSLNLAYFLYFKDFIHISYYCNLFDESMEVFRRNAIPLEASFHVVFLDLPAAVLLVLFYPALTGAVVRQRRRFLLLSAGAGLAFLLDLVVIGMIKGEGDEGAYQYYTHRDGIVKKYGMVVHNGMDFYNKLGAAKDLGRIKYGAPLSRSEPLPPRANVIMIQVESLGAGIINFEYKGKYITPFLHRLADECVFYPYTLSYHYAGGTSDCEIAVLNSYEPLEDVPTIKLEQIFFMNSLARRFTRADYGVFAFHGNTGNFFWRKRAYQRMGFLQFYDYRAMQLKEVVWGAPDQDVFEYVMTKAKSEKMPFLYYLITMSSHEPFKLAANYYHNSQYDEICHELIRDYFNSMSYVDKQLETLMTFIRQNLPDTYVFIYGDHTPFKLGNAPYRRLVLHINDKEMEFVPLYIITPDHRVYAEKQQVATFLDVAPTVLNAAGISYRYRSDGTDLLAYPLADGPVPWRGMEYSRASLYSLLRSEQLRIKQETKLEKW